MKLLGPVTSCRHVVKIESSFVMAVTSALELKVAGVLLEKEINENIGWLHKLLGLKKSSSETSGTAFNSSRVSSPSSAPSIKIPSTPPLQSALKSPLRWNKKYDVFVCHSSVESDVEAAVALVSFLEGSPRGLRCFLWDRDADLGGAVASELCRAVGDSHMRALLISPHFLQDGWCRYMMHQTLAEGPMSGRTVPLLCGLSPSECPQELRFYYCISLNSNAERGYTLLNTAVLNYLRGLAKQEQTLALIMDSSGSGLSGVGEPEDEQGSAKDSAETSMSTETARTAGGDVRSCDQPPPS